MRKEINYLQKHYGNHTKVAEILGISPRHWRKIRHDQKITPSLKNLIQTQIRLLKMKELT